MFECPTDLSMHPEKLTHRHLFIRQKIHITSLAQHLTRTSALILTFRFQSTPNCTFIEVL